MSRHGCRIAVVLAVGGWLGVPASSRAEGLINNLPADGSWVVFRAKSEIDFQGNLQSFDREFKLASVGKQDVEGEPGRWIEISTEFGGRKVLAKLLIAEKYLKADQNPFQHVAKAWARGPEGEVREFPEARLRQLLIFALAVPHFEKLERKGKETVKTELGEYECERCLGQTEFEALPEMKAKFDGNLWTHDKVPFGLVKAKIKADLGLGTMETELEAVRSGSDAKSELPDAK